MNRVVALRWNTCPFDIRTIQLITPARAMQHWLNRGSPGQIRGMVANMQHGLVNASPTCRRPLDVVPTRPYEFAMHSHNLANTSHVGSEPTGGTGARGIAE